MPKPGRPRVALIGGDQRELILLEALVQSGMDVKAVGYPELPSMPEVKRVGSVPEAVAGASVVIAPMSNTDEAGVITACLDREARLVLDEEAFRAMSGPLFIGAAKPIIQRMADRFGVHVVQLAELDEIAVLNSIPTAEGAIQRAMTELPVTLHGSRVLVIGFGRCAITLARMLAGIGAKVRVVARDKGQLARAYEMGLAVSGLTELEAHLPTAVAVFNTVPAPVLGRPQLERMAPGALVIDVASAPGGTDFKAAESLGIKAFLDLGIPGRVAPQTAGEVLARTVPDLVWAVFEGDV